LTFGLAIQIRRVSTRLTRKRPQRPGGITGAAFFRSGFGGWTPEAHCPALLGGGRSYPWIFERRSRLPVSFIELRPANPIQSEFVSPINAPTAAGSNRAFGLSVIPSSGPRHSGGRFLMLTDGEVSRVAKGADCKSAAVGLRRFESFLPHQASLAKREKAATPKPDGRRRAAAASYGSASHASC
jgi:hypothetical protein